MKTTTKGEARRARKAGVLRDFVPEHDGARDRAIFSETARGDRARYKWARRYDLLNGRPESEEDR